MRFTNRARAFLLTKMSSTSIKIKAWVSNYIHAKDRYAITYPCASSNGDLAKPPLKLGYGWLITTM